MRMELRHRALDKLYKRRDRIEMPDYQREEVWSVEKKRKLIDTILKGWHLPKMYFRVLDDGTIECIDGQQRLVTIWEFFDDNLRLDEESANRFGGAMYSSLLDDVSDAFDDFELDVEEIEDATEGDLRDLFLRLQLGTPLNTAEKLNAIGGDLHSFCRKASQHSFFVEKVTLRDTRYTYFFITTQWVCIEARGIQPQMRFPQLESLLVDNRSFSENSELAQIIKRSLEYLDSAFPEKNAKLRNRANVLSVCLLASSIVRQKLDKGTAIKFGDFVDIFFSRLAEEVERGAKGVRNEYLRYQEAVSYGSTGGESIKTRLHILTRALATSYPEFSRLLSADRGSKTETEQAIEAQSQAISDLVYSVNQHYAGEHGEDLFKMTNKSVSALSTISSPCYDIAAYGKFIDALYFLVYEGSGSCKRLPSPPPEMAMDIKFLRTGLRHDVDHGKGKEIARKRIRNAKIFEKYSGKKTPSECGPEDFVVIQLRLFDALKELLEELMRK